MPKKQVFDSPLAELNSLLDRIEDRIQQSRDEAIAPPKAPSRGLRRFISGQKEVQALAASADQDRQRRNSLSKSSPPGPPPLTPTTPVRGVRRLWSSEGPRDLPTVPVTPPSYRFQVKQARKATASFMKMDRVEELVEDLRRVAELVVIGENVTTSIQIKEEKAFQRSKERWSKNRDVLAFDEEEGDAEVRETVVKEEEYVQLFDLFFERGALAILVNLLKGVEGPDPTSATSQGRSEDDKPPHTLLPPLAVATQAIQSIAILIQNVTRATSLFIILSNNHINELVELNLQLYTAAERVRQKQESSSGDGNTFIFASAPVVELTTHFVTFLKSLAMRMNAETLQFFLKYPTESAAPISSSYFSGGSFDNDDDEPIPAVEFPLYTKALEFCAAHQDSMVRLTAMNICLNTLRLITVAPTPENDDEDEEAAGLKSNMGSSPDANLSKAQALPFRERLAIARFTCQPARVEKLISPIFTKLAEKWTALDEQIQLLEQDARRGGTGGEGGGRNTKVAKAKEKVKRERRLRSLKDKGADLQDELLFLDDVFKVRLTVLNEQMIEMMFATFVYPLLLQPVLLYHQRLNALLDRDDRFDSATHPFGGRGGDLGDMEVVLEPVSAPAKTALFTLTGVFQHMTNRPLVRLLFTALLHPLAPDSTSVPTVRSRLEVATLDERGQRAIRLDAEYVNDGPVPGDRTTYDFGTTPMNRRRAKSDEVEVVEDDSCTFVLSPALAELLEFRGEDVALITRTRPNPYRRAILSCLEAPDHFAEIRELAVSTIDAALNLFESKFAADLVFGTDLKSFADDVPMDERNLESQYARSADNRGIGESIQHESRHSASRQKGGSVGSDLTGEVVGALCRAIIVASKESSSPDYRFGYDDVAAHALISCIRQNTRAMVQASKALETLYRQATAAFAELPGKSMTPMGSPAFVDHGSPSVNADNYEQQIFNYVLSDVLSNSTKAPLTKHLVRPNDSDETAARLSSCLPIAYESNFNALGDRVGKSLLVVDSGAPSLEMEIMQRKGEDAVSVLRLDALLSLARHIVSTAGMTIRDKSLAGLAALADGSIIHGKDLFTGDTARRTYGKLSPDMIQAILVDGGTDTEIPKTGDVVDFAGSPALPCVTEAPASAAPLFSSNGSGVVAEGVTWQSLYLVFQKGLIVFAQPLPGESNGQGRVISACRLECILVELDTLPTENGSPARRLMLSYEGTSRNPPPLFLFDAIPELEETGPFLKAKPFVSQLDVWFEDKRAAEYANHVITRQIFNAKAERGARLQKFLKPY